MVLHNSTYTTLAALVFAASAFAAGADDYAECSGNDPDRVVAACTRVIQGGQGLLRQRALAFYNRALAYRKNKDFDRAIADYTEVIKLDPNNVQAYNNRGVAWQNMSDFERAIVDYSTAIRLAPNEIQAFNNRC